MEIIRALLGVAFLVTLCWFFSTDRKKIQWPLVIKGIALQMLIGLLILGIPSVPWLDAAIKWLHIGQVFEWIADKFVDLSTFAMKGADFLFGEFSTGTMHPAFSTFAFKVLPSILFFAALTSLLYYFGILQIVVYGFAWLMRYTLKVSGRESLAAAGNIFLGQTESPLLIRPYIEKMTRSEMLCLMTGGMATIAGGVMVAYISFLGGDDPLLRLQFAKHLLTASIMSAPAAIVASKILVPETEEFDKELKVSKEKLGSNVLEAVTNGTTDGLKLAVNVGAMLLVFTAIIYMLNAILFKVGDWTQLNSAIAANTTYPNLSFQMLLGYLFSPVAWLIGVSANDMLLVGQLLGEKTILNEFFAYTTLGNMKNSGALTDFRSIWIATYALCGFSNIASIGIQIGGIGTLAPAKRTMLSQLGVRALIGGTVACLFTAAIVGMFI